MMELVSDNYSDDEGRDKKVIRGLLLYYFRSNRSVYVWKKVKSLKVADSEMAQLTLAVVLAGKPFAEDVNLTKIQADMFRFDFLLEKDGGDWQVVDLGSTNGVKVNGRQVDSTRLAPGDEVTLGTTSFVFDIEQ